MMNGGMNVQMVIWRKKRWDKKIDKQMDGWTDGNMEEGRVGLIDKHTDGRADGYMEEGRVG